MDGISGGICRGSSDSKNNFDNLSGSRFGKVEAARTFHAILLPAVPTLASDGGKRRPPIAASLILAWLRPVRKRRSYAFLIQNHLQ